MVLHLVQEEAPLWPAASAAASPPAAKDGKMLLLEQKVETLQQRSNDQIHTIAVLQNELLHLEEALNRTVLDEAKTRA